MESTVSMVNFISVIAAVLAALFAGGSLWHSVRTHNKQEDLIKELGYLQRELTALDLRNAKERELTKEKAAFTARFVGFGSNGSKHLVITNVGSTQARDVRIDFDERTHFVLPSEVDELFPCELDSSESVKLLATTSLGNEATRESFTLSWVDGLGRDSKKFNVQYR
ncbi:hypothetical protein [Shewanella algae]|uniref:hypothetical protein n=1 Tax=Shewanella algae TaxID=38313 RepID=UPI001FBBE06D|nr:hypothetical protein [Shewanella algae]